MRRVLGAGSIGWATRGTGGGRRGCKQDRGNTERSHRDPIIIGQPARRRLMPLLSTTTARHSMSDASSASRRIRICGGKWATSMNEFHASCSIALIGYLLCGMHVSIGCSRAGSISACRRYSSLAFFCVVSRGFVPVRPAKRKRTHNMRRPHKAFSEEKLIRTAYCSNAS